MTTKERYAKLKTNQKLFTWWWIILVLNSLAFLAAVAITFLGTAVSGIISPTFGAGVGIIGLLFVALTLIVPLSIYWMEKWVIILLWLSFVGQILSLLSDAKHHAVAFVISGLSLYAYREILKFVYGGNKVSFTGRVSSGS